MSESSLRTTVLWILDETNIIVTSTTAAWLLRCLVGSDPSTYTTHPAGAVWFVAGAVSASTIAKLLKRYIRQPRPETHKMNSSSAALRRTIGRPQSVPTNGMPSTHSTTILFFSTYIFLSLFPSPSPLIAAAALVGGSTIAWSRIALGHHTPEQVLAGVGLGVLLGTGHWVAWNGARSVGLVGLRAVGEGYFDLAEVVAKRCSASAFLIVLSRRTDDRGSGTGRTIDAALARFGSFLPLFAPQLPTTTFASFTPSLHARCIMSASPVPGLAQPATHPVFDLPSTAAARVFSIPDLLYTIAFFVSAALPTAPSPTQDEIERSRARLAIDHPALLALARVGRAAVPSAYTQLYRSIKLNGKTPQLHDTRLANIVRTLQETDGLIPQVRALEVIGTGGRRDEEPNLSTLFGLTNRLNHLVLSSEDILGWGWDYRLLPASLTSLTLRSVDLARLPSLLKSTPNLVSLSFAPQRYRPTRAPEWPQGLRLRELDVQMRCCSTARMDPAQDYLLTLMETVQPTLERLTMTTVDDGCKAHHWGGDDVQVPVLQYLTILLTPLASTLLHLSLADPTRISTPADPESWSLIQEVLATFSSLQTLTYLGKNLLPSLLPSLPATLQTLNIQSHLPITLPHTIGPNVNTYLLSRSSLAPHSAHHARASSVSKDEQAFSVVASVHSDDADDDEMDGGEAEDYLRLPTEAKVCISSAGAGEAWTPQCEDDVDALRALVVEGGVKEMKLEKGVQPEGTDGQGVVFLLDGTKEEEGKWGKVDRGCVEWGIRVRW